MNSIKKKSLQLFVIVFLSISILSLHSAMAQSVSAERMTSAAVHFLVSLSEAQKQKAVLSLSSTKQAEWRYFPEPSKLTSLILPKRQGLSYASLTQSQQIALKGLLTESVSQQGSDAVDAALELDKDDSIKFRGLLNWILFSYGVENYFVTFFGSPTDSEWAWRLEGHHISLNFSIKDGKIVDTYPLFIGTTKGQVVVGDKSVKVLEDVAEFAKALASSLTAPQLESASQSIEKVPKFNPIAPGLMGGGSKASSALSDKGLSISLMSMQQQGLIISILKSYQNHFPSPVALENIAALEQTGLDGLELIWAGDTSMENPFYFRIQGPKFVLEFNTSEGHADHYHTAWISR